MGRSESTPGLVALGLLVVFVALPVLLLLGVVAVVVMPMAVLPLRPRRGGYAEHGPARGAGSEQGGRREEER